MGNYFVIVFKKKKEEKKKLFHSEKQRKKKKIPLRIFLKMHHLINTAVNYPVIYYPASCNQSFQQITALNGLIAPMDVNIRD